MRLIDTADAFTVLTEYYHHRTEEMHNSLREALDRVPTVDAVPKADYMSMQATVKKLTDALAERDYHAMWIPVDEHIAKCSHCGAWEYTHGKDKTKQALIHRATKRYCPSCGAKMDRSIGDEPKCERCIHSDKHMKGNKNVYCEILRKIVPANGECWQYSQKPTKKPEKS